MRPATTRASLASRACIEARRRRAAAAEPVHLLAVVLDAPDVTRDLRDLGLDPTELRERLDARLSAEDSLGGYRDANDTALTPALERVLERLETRRWRLLGARTTCVEALLPEPSIAALVFELRRGNDHRHILARASALASMSGHATIGIEHVFRVLLDIRSFAETLERAEGVSAGLRDAVEARLAENAPSANPSGATPPIGARLRRVLSAIESTAQSSGAPAASIRRLCLELARHDDAASLWAAAGIDHAAFVRAVHLPDATP
jgi:ATP-dependent Clp protease ATP-binding subunit ClpA